MLYILIMFSKLGFHCKIAYSHYRKYERCRKSSMYKIIAYIRLYHHTHIRLFLDCLKENEMSYKFFLIITFYHVLRNI